MLIANMHGKNQAQFNFSEIINHLLQQTDMVVFTDDCSRDMTPHIAELLGAKVKQTTVPSPMPIMLREAAWEHVSEYAETGDWILSINCNEKYYPPPADLFDQTQYEVLDAVVCYMWDQEHYVGDGRFAPSFRPRLFRYRKDAEFFKGKEEPDYVWELVRRRSYKRESGAAIQSFKYITPEARIDAYQSEVERFGESSHDLLNDSLPLIEWPS